jgi:hypothetical protein
MNKVWLGLLALVVVVACSDAVGTMLEDAGTMMQDGGAQAQDGAAHDVVCDKVRVQTTKSYDRDGVLAATVTQRQEYAELEVPDFANVAVETCLERAQDTWVTCPASTPRAEVSCTGLLQEQGCSYIKYAYHVGNTVYIGCDNTYEFDYVDPATPDSSSGTRYSRITAYY